MLRLRPTVPVTVPAFSKRFWCVVATASRGDGVEVWDRSYARTMQL